MRQSVVIKASASGLTVYLDPDLPFPYLLSDVASRFQETGRFFQNAKVVLSLEGRELTPEEEQKIIHTILEHSPVQIRYILDKDQEREQFFRRMVEEEQTSKKELSIGQFYRGHVNDGERLEIEGDLTILGDVKAGARIIAGGSVIILGALQGSVFAGVQGKKPSFIAAMDMLPSQLRIGECLIKGTDELFAGKRKVPSVTFLKDGHMQLVPMNQFDATEL